MSQEPQIESLPAGLVHEPLNWLFAEHYRHRQLCRLIERVGTATLVLREEVEEILHFLRHDMPLHIIDEEDDLFPLLRRRCLPEDELGPMLGALSADHHDDIERTRILIGHLEQALNEGVAPGQDRVVRQLFTDFVLHERRHIALENAVILPIARLRLTPEDQVSLSRRMAARRGVVLEISDSKAGAALVMPIEAGP